MSQGSRFDDFLVQLLWMRERGMRERYTGRGGGEGAGGGKGEGREHRGEEEV